MAHRGVRGKAGLSLVEGLQMEFVGCQRLAVEAHRMTSQASAPSTDNVYQTDTFEVRAARNQGTNGSGLNFGAVSRNSADVKHRSSVALIEQTVRVMHANRQVLSAGQHIFVW